jgi:aryl-alcohol dehydrogenase-like predicted oxidoreductase
VQTVEIPGAAFRPSRIGLGLWPIAGVTTIGVEESRARQTIAAAIDAGITCFDTAFSYGLDGRSDRLLGDVARHCRDQLFIVGKAGTHYDAEGQRRIDASPERLKRETAESLRRSRLDRFDLLLLHQPDPQVPMERSAEALADLQREGLTQAIGLCNADLIQLEAFASVAIPSAVQLPFNLIQRQATAAVRQWCQDHDVRTLVYWVLMKGLLAGKIGPDHRFLEGDSRPKYSQFRGESRQRTDAFLAGLQQIAARFEITVAQLVVAATLAQPTIDIALVGAHRPEQIVETAATGSVQLDPQTLEEIEALLSMRGDEPFG